MGSSHDCTQPFTTGSNVAGYTLTSIELVLGSGRDGFVNPPTVKLFSGSATGTEEATFTGPTLLTPDQSGKAYTFTPSSSVTLSASTRYWIVAEGGSNHMNWNDTQETEESGTPAAGWSIGDNGGYRRANETGPFSDRTRPRKIRVNGTIASTNAPPTASHNTVTMDEDTGYMFAVASFNYLDSDGDALSSVKIVTLPGSGKGTLKLDATAIVSEDLPKTVTKDDLDNNKLEYSPPSNGNGTGYASFTFKVNDDTVDSTLAYTMTIDINQVNAPANAAPTASDNTVTTGEVEALVALYETTSGENWEDNANWKTGEPLHTWYGVTLDAEGWVTGLDLGGNGLRGEIPPAVVVNLQRLRSLYLNDNRLTAVPLAQFEALVSTPDSVLEELALWGNQGLVGMENISPELGRRVDRAALRALYDNNGGPGWREEENWLDEADPFSFSVWYGVMTNDNGRVSELDLAGNGLTGELTDGLEELRGLERLYLYGNAGLSGVLPLGLMELPELRMVDIVDTGVCAPEDATFQRWLAGINFHGEICAEVADKDSSLEQSGGGGCAVTSTSNTGYTPHSTAFDLLLVVSAMLLLALRRNNSRQGKT